MAAEQIARAIVRHRGRVTAFVPHYAISGGSLVAMAADEIVMDENAVLGPVDPQIGQFPASLPKVVEQKPISEIDDQTEEKAEELAITLATGRWTHGRPSPGANGVTSERDGKQR